MLQEIIKIIANANNMASGTAEKRHQKMGGFKVKPDFNQVLR